MQARHTDVVNALDAIAHDVRGDGGLFGDGAAAMVLSGGSRPPPGAAPRVLATRSIFYPDTERIMGWDLVEGGFKVVLSAKVPSLVTEHVRSDVDGFLAAQGVRRADIRHWIAHTGGPKVLQAFESALELPPEALRRSRMTQRQCIARRQVLQLPPEIQAAQQVQSRPAPFRVPVLARQ